MANSQADGATALGVIVSIFFAPVTGGASLLGIPAVLGARAIRAARDNADNYNNEEEDRPMRSLVPYRPFPMRSFCDDRMLDIPQLGRFDQIGQIAPLDPDAILADYNPSGFRRLQERRSDETFLLGVTRSFAPAVEAMVLRHPCPRHLHVSGRVRRTFFGGTKFDFDVDIS